MIYFTWLLQNFVQFIENIKNKYKLSRKEICTANFLPPAKKRHPLLIKSQNSDP